MSGRSAQWTKQHLGHSNERAQSTTTATDELSQTVSELNRLKAILDNVKDLIVELDGDGLITYANHRSVDFLGRQPHELVGCHFGQFIHPNDVKIVEDRFGRRINGEDVVECFEARVLHTDGNSCWCEVNVSPIRDGDMVRGVRSIARDISQRRCTEQRLRESEAIQRSIMENSADYILLTDLDGVIRYVNRTDGDLPTEQVIGTSVFDYVESSFHERMSNCFKYVCETMQPGRYDVDRYSDADQLVHSFDARVSPVIQDGRVVALTINSTDVTERKRVEQQFIEQQARLAHFERLSATGEMVVGIAHEVNQPLSAIANFAGACSRLAADPDIDRDLLQHWLSKISEASNRTGDIIRRLRSFVNKSEVEKLLCDVHQIIDESLKLMSSELRRCGVRLNVAKNDAGLEVLCDAIQIQQVLVNLLKNACDALMASEYDLRQVHIDARDRDNHIEVVVADSGPGFADVDTEQLFRRFFTSKKDGMGIGLAISRSIIEAHHGQLWADTSDLGGAAFHFTLPKQRPQEAPKIVCVIDDDPAALSSMCALVHANGWKAIGFATAREFFAHAPERFECLVIDVDLPDTNGLEVQRTMRRRQPEIPIIMVSGHADERVASEAIREGAVTFLSKPFRPSAFSDAVSIAIGQTRQDRRG